MKILRTKKSIRLLTALVPLLSVILSLSFGSVGFAAATCPNGATAPGGDATKCCVVGNEKTCFTNTTDPAAGQPAATSCTAQNCNLINKYVNPLITLMSALVGVVVTASIVVGGIQYSSSGGDPQKAAAARNRIRNSIIALIAFMFLFAFLQFLVPGGIFRS